jgi:hypothetical protein
LSIYKYLFSNIAVTLARASDGQASAATNEWVRISPEAGSFFPAGSGALVEILVNPTEVEFVKRAQFARPAGRQWHDALARLDCLPHACGTFGM